MPLVIPVVVVAVDTVLNLVVLLVQVQPDRVSQEVWAQMALQPLLLAAAAVAQAVRVEIHPKVRGVMVGLVSPPP
jgi:hypothetical protein